MTDVGLPRFPWDPGLRLSCGVSRSGKTHHLQRVVWAATERIPVIVLDRKNEVRIPEQLASITAICRSVRDAAGWAKHGKRYLIVRPGDVDASALLEEACEWAREGAATGKAHSRATRGVAMSEAHRAMPNGRPLKPATDECVTAWAHCNCDLFFDVQRLAKLETTVSENASELRLYTVTGSTDFQRVREIGGRDLENAVRVCGERFDAGQPGWHVKLGVSRRGPFVPTREP